MREALARAETEAEEAGARHRTWMRQAQARQTELEATAAQLAEALAEAERKAHPGATEVGSSIGSLVSVLFLCSVFPVPRRYLLLIFASGLVFLIRF